MMKTLLIPGAVTLALAAALPAAAQSSNFSTWATFGDVLASAPGATLTTANVGAAETPLSGTSALPWYALEDGLGTSFDVDTYEGSALVTSFSAAAGTQIGLSWALSSTDSDPSFADRAYFILDGVAQTLAQVGVGAQSGLFSLTLASGGTHTLGFALLDVNDVTGLSTLSVSGLTVTPAVPEPASIALLLAGIAAVGGAARRRRQGMR